MREVAERMVFTVVRGVPPAPQQPADRTTGTGAAWGESGTRSRAWGQAGHCHNARLPWAHGDGAGDYRQALVVERLDDDAPPFDGIARLGFPSIEAFETRFFDSRDGRRAIAKDTARFVDVEKTEIRLLREIVLAS